MLFETLSLQGFLSFGSDPAEIELRPLNVVIGPNGSGKSNLIEALSVLRAVPTDLPLPIRNGGGVRDWLWNGPHPASEARLEVAICPGRLTSFPKQNPTIRYSLGFGVEGTRLNVVDERLENTTAQGYKGKPYFYFGYENGRPMLNVRPKPEDQVQKRYLERAELDPTQSIIKQRRDPESYPELSRLGDLLRGIRIYRDWSFGPTSKLREACRSDVDTSDLSETLDNLPARLLTLKLDSATEKRIQGLLRTLGDDYEDFKIATEGGLLQLYVQIGGRNVAARRLSDGTLRFLCLLAILVDPEPPPLIAIEEPELGLHPDMFPTIRDLLLDASSRTQLVVTTHSTQLVDALTDHAECVMVAERREGVTSISRLEQPEVDRRKSQGGLARLWMSGQLGGTRW